MTMEETVRALADELMLYFGFLADHNHIKIRESLISMYRAGEQAERDACEQVAHRIGKREMAAGRRAEEAGRLGVADCRQAGAEVADEIAAAIRRGPSQDKEKRDGDD